QWTAGESAWFPYGAWDARKVARDLEPGETIWVGFDGSYSGDSTALVAATADGFIQVLGVWENPGRKGWRVPRAEVEDALAVTFATYDVRELLCDPPYWQREISEWEKRWPGKVIEWPTYVRARMAPACTQFYSAVLDGRLTHQDDPRLARHVANAVVRPTPQGDLITKAAQDSPAKIDLAVAAVIAYSRAALAAPRRARIFVR
ncbi:MAG TPA: terminase TerL endonuclease subunit, partial [Mycobacteriales bacterium]|nr:terminase TerL endonuclease subunit [Mycobacteriales bacterium]